MTNPETEERVATGLGGKIAAKAKQAAGSLLGNDTLQAEGNLQEAASDAELKAQRKAADADKARAAANIEEERAQVVAERDRIKAEISAEDRDAAIEADRRKAEMDANQQAAQEKAAAENARRAEEARADIVDPGTPR